MAPKKKWAGLSLSEDNSSFVLANGPALTCRPLVSLPSIARRPPPVSTPAGGGRRLACPQARSRRPARCSALLGGDLRKQLSGSREHGYDVVDGDEEQAP
jgi:hypothetical protein